MSELSPDIVLAKLTCKLGLPSEKMIKCRDACVKCVGGSESDRQCLEGCGYCLYKLSNNGDSISDL